jgi:hypothetical protein
VLAALERLVAGDLANVLVRERIAGRRTTLGVASVTAAGAGHAARHVAQHHGRSHLGAGGVLVLERKGLEAGNSLRVEPAAAGHVDGSLAGWALADVAVLGARVDTAV